MLADQITSHALGEAALADPACASERDETVDRHRDAEGSELVGATDERSERRRQRARHLANLDAALVDQHGALGGDELGTGFDPQLFDEQRTRPFEGRQGIGLPPGRVQRLDQQDPPMLTERCRSDQRLEVADHGPCPCPGVVGVRGLGERTCREQLLGVVVQLLQPNTCRIGVGPAIEVVVRCTPPQQHGVGQSVSGSNGVLEVHRVHRHQRVEPVPTRDGLYETITEPIAQPQDQRRQRMPRARRQLVAEHTIGDRVAVHDPTKTQREHRHQRPFPPRGNQLPSVVGRHDHGPQDPDLHSAAA